MTPSLFVKLKFICRYRNARDLLSGYIQYRNFSTGYPVLFQPFDHAELHSKLYQKDPKIAMQPTQISHKATSYNMHLSLIYPKGYPNRFI